MATAEAAGLFGNFYLVSFVFWPSVVIVAALVNMLITFQFSWSELVLDYMIGFVIGVCFYHGTIGDVNAAEHFFLYVSTGLLGLLNWLNVFEGWTVAKFFWLCAGGTVGAVLVTALLDYAAAAIGWGSTGAKVGNGFFSILIIIFKGWFAHITSVIGIIIGIIGLIKRATVTSPSGGGFGIVGGAFWFEWGGSGTHATTFGWVVNVFNGTINSALRHELVHTRQYIYMNDWLGIFYFTIAGLWGIISSAINAAASTDNFEGRHYFSAHSSKEVGNPIEMVPEHKYHAS